MLIHVKAIGEDGEVAFEGTLPPKEVGYILNVGINYLLSIGASIDSMEEGDVVETDEDDDEPEIKIISPGSDALN